MRLLLIFITSITLLMSSVLPSSSEPEVPELRKIFHYSKDNSSEAVQFTLNGAHIPQIFKLGGEKQRLVLDFIDTKYGGNSRPVTDDAKLVVGIRVGLHTQPKTYTRVVIDLQPGAVVEWSQLFIEESNVFEVILVAEEQVVQNQQSAVTKTLVRNPTTKKAPASVVVTQQVKKSKPEPPKASSAVEEPLTEPETIATTQSTKEVPASVVEVQQTKQSEPDPPEVSSVVKESSAEPETSVTTPSTKEIPVSVVEVQQEKQSEPEPPEVGSVVKEPLAEPETSVDIPASKETPASVAEVQQEKLSEPDPPEVSSGSPESSAEPSPATVIAKPQEETVAPAESSPGPVLVDVSFDNTYTRRGEMVLFRLDEFQPPVVTASEMQTPLIICEFKNGSLAPDVNRLITSAGRYVDNIRVEETEELPGVRVILELVPGRDYDLRQVFFKENNLFVLIVNDLNPYDHLK